MKDFFKKNWFGVVMAAGFGILGWLTYKGGKLDGELEAWTECHNMLTETIEDIQENVTE